MTKKRYFDVLIVLFVCVLVSGSCSNRPPTSIPVPIIVGTLTPTQTTNVSEAPDDIVTTQFGITYRTPVETITTKLVNDSSTALVEYRKNIKTKSNEIRNNIISVTKDNTIEESQYWDSSSIRLYTLGAPQDLKIVQNGFWPHLGTVATVLVIEVPQDFKLGRYDFNIRVMIKGEDYGILPCTLEVVE